MEKTILFTVAALPCCLLAANPAAAQTNFQEQLKTLMDYARDNFKKIPAGYKLEGAVSGSLKKAADGSLFYRSVMSPGKSLKAAEAAITHLAEKIKLAAGDSAAYMEKKGSSNLKEITFTSTKNAGAEIIRVGAYKAKKKIIVYIDVWYKQPAGQKAGDEIAARVKKIIVDKLGVDEKEVTSNASFTNDLGADSLDTVELVMEAEKEFNISIPDEEAEKIITVGQAITYLENRLAKK